MFDFILALFDLFPLTRRSLVGLALGLLAAYVVWQLTASLSFQEGYATIALIVVFLWVVIPEENENLPR
ncbi:MAG: hypothetical protein PHI11_04100 [Gallionella sp.]|nr:hypothetical protein [Gallionella sp.]